MIADIWQKQKSEADENISPYSTITLAKSELK